MQNATDIDKTVNTILNDLIEVSKDGEQGFRQAASGAHDSQLKALFSECAADCARAATELQGVVTLHGGKPESSGSVAGALHRGWMQIKAAAGSNDDTAILEEVERGEDSAKTHYRKALDRDLPADVRALVERQYQGVVQHHDQIRDLRNQWRASPHQ
ncbi:PA2169 family four-helix-bundle protein [Robbsia andropogonis]|uniref:PA2169 family four-helix-bundle protein n=1 Tax=Robbsia andropogonis TaxID=28092 RepID=UPI003899E92A